MLFSTGIFSLKQVGMMLMGNVVAVLLGTFFNNLSDKRQYPTTWMVIRPSMLCESVVCFRRAKEADETSMSQKKSTKVALPKETVPKSSIPVNSAIESPGPLDPLQPRSSILEHISSLVGKAMPLQAAASQTTNDIVESDNHPSLRENTSNEPEETIDLSTVLAQARNPSFFVVDHQNSANGSVFHISPATMDSSQTINNSIQLSAVIDAARSQSDKSVFMVENEQSGTNRSLVRVSRVQGGDAQEATSSPQSYQDGTMSSFIVFDNSGQGPQTNSFLVGDTQTNNSNASVVRFSPVNNFSESGSDKPTPKSTEQSEEDCSIVEA